MVDRYVSNPIELSPAIQAGEYQRADLVFHGVDHSGASYEGRVYLNAPEADRSSGREHPCYVGSFHIFGHGGCFGDLGHCDVPTGPRDPFDLRPAHQLTPATKVVIITDGLGRLLLEPSGTGRAGGSVRPPEITVTVVAVVPGGSSNDAVLGFNEVRLLTYR
jgi:hypothetical protein